MPDATDLTADSRSRRLTIHRPRIGLRGFGLLGNVGLLIMIIYVFAATIGPALLTTAPNHLTGAAPNLKPSSQFIFGTDELGRSEFSRIVAGARIAVLAAVESVIVALALGTALGVVAGYIGGIVDELLSRLMDFLFAFPAYLLGILVIVVLGPGLTHAALAIGLVFAPQFGRIARTTTIGLRERAYVEAARLSKRPARWIIVRHILPNIAGPMSVMVGLTLSNAEGAYAVLSYLGFGVTPPTADYGTMLSSAQPFMLTDAWLAIFPSAAVVLLILGFIFIGDLVRELLDPHGQIMIGRNITIPVTAGEVGT